MAELYIWTGSFFERSGTIILSDYSSSGVGMHARRFVNVDNVDCFVRSAYCLDSLLFGVCSYRGSLRPLTKVSLG